MVLVSSFWLIWLVHAVLSNVIVASFIAIMATMVGWRLRNPAMAHGLWVLVLIKLITPPIFCLPIPMPAWLSPLQFAIVANPYLEPFLADAAGVGSNAYPIAPDTGQNDFGAIARWDGSDASSIDLRKRGQVS